MTEQGVIICVSLAFSLLAPLICWVGYRLAEKNRPLGDAAGSAAFVLVVVWCVAVLLCLSLVVQTVVAGVMR